MSISVTRTRPGSATGRAMVIRVPRQQCSEAEALEFVRTARATLVVVDVEPLLARWDTGDAMLTAGVARISAQLPRVRLIFVTNSGREPRTPLPSGSRYI